jgi:uncharacterized membrane protein HdeD (DUF308 family)
MTIFGNGLSSATDLPVPPTWVRLLLGTVMVVAGILVLGDVAVASLLSAVFIGIMAIVAGGFEMVHAFWTKGWGSLLWHLLLGALYVAFGVTMVSQPVAGALVLTFVLGLIILSSGVVRIFFALRHWGELSWLMLISGVFGVIAGFIILSGWPVTGLWVLGLLLGIDLIVHGVAWLTHGLLPRRA